MTGTIQTTFTAFDGNRRIAAGTLASVALAVKAAEAGGAAGPVLIYDDSTGRIVDVDLRGTDADIARRLESEGDAAPAPRGRGRPRLGVVSREVTLLPRHWDWLSAQPGGASVTLRRLVDEARRAGGDRERGRRARDAAYAFMSSAAGNLHGFEEAARALFAGDRPRFEAMIAGWPADLRDHAVRLAFGAAEG